MGHDASFLGDFGLVLVVASVACVVFRLLRLPTLVGYLATGLAVGPAIPIPIFADASRMEALAELGVVLVMFAVGLEFSLRRLVTVLPRAGFTAVVQMSGLAWCGFMAGRMLAFTSVESLFLGASLAVSSTMVVARVFDSETVDTSLRELVFGVLVVQDVVAVALIAVLTAVASGSGVSAGEVASVVGTLVVVLVAMIAAGLLLVPRLVRFLVVIGSAEVLVVTSLGVCFGFALLARSLGYSVALGAFLAGMLVAESGRSRRVEVLVQPLRDLFAAVFFVSIGMIVDPSAALANGPVALVLALVIVGAQFMLVTLASLLGGNGLRASARAGVYLGQIGEFSFIMITIGTAAGVVDPDILSIVVTVAALTSFTTPVLGRVSETIAEFIDRKLPRRVQTVLSLYESWFRTLSFGGTQKRSRVRRLALVVLVDAIAIVALAIGTSLFHETLTGTARRAGMGETWADVLIIGAEFGCSVPFALGLLRSSKALADLVAGVVLPRREEHEVDLAVAPRRVLAVAFRLVIILAVGAPVVALTQPFVPPGAGFAVLAVVVATLGALFWRDARNLQGHVRAGAEVLVELLARQREAESTEHAFEDVLPGLGSLSAARVELGSTACGKSLGALNIRAHTGATIVAIRRGEDGILTPSGRDILLAGDLLALSGTDEAIRAASAMLSAPEPGTP